MRVELVEFPGLKRVIEAEVSPEESVDALKRAYEELRHRVRLPGFRKGHIPRPVLERYFRKDVEANVRERLLNQGLEEAIEKYSLDLATHPKLVKDLAFTPGELCRFHLEVELKPKISLKPLETFHVVDDSNTSVADDEVLSMLAYLQKVNAPYASLSSGDTLLPEDLARLKGVFHAEGGEAHEVELEGIVDSEFRLILDPRHAPLQPESPWDGEGDFVYTGDFPYLPGIPEIVRGKRGTFRARLVHAQRKRLPVLDDEFAKDLGLSTLDELKGRVRDDIQREKELRARELMKEKVANAIMEGHDVGLPEGVLEEAIQRHVAALERSGDHKDTDKDKVHARVARQLKWYYLSEALTRQAGIEVADAEVEAFLRRRFSDKGVALPPGLYDEARRVLLDEKLYDYLLANVTLKRGDAA